MARLIEFTRVEWVECIPRPLVEGVLYVSERFRGSAHLCPCGCGVEIFIPVRMDYPESDLYWDMHVSADRLQVTFHPSLLNRIPCHSHYFIKHNRIEWC